MINKFQRNNSFKNYNGNGIWNVISFVTAPTPMKRQKTEKTHQGERMGSTWEISERKKSIPYNK